MAKWFAPLSLTFAALGACCLLTGCNQSGGSGQTQYRVAEVKTGTVKKTVTATGVLTAWKTVDIKSRAGGRLVSLPVDEGKTVTKGQIIAKIDPSDTLLTYNSAKADIDANHARVEETQKVLSLQKDQTQSSIKNAEASLDSAVAAENAAKARWESAKSTAAVQRELSESAIENATATLAAEQEHLNQLQTASHPQQHASALASFHEAEANAKNAEQQLGRQKKLLAKGFIAQSQVDQAQASYDVALAVLTSAQEKMNTIKPELDTDLKAQAARVKQADAALKTAKANMVQIGLKKQDADVAYAQYQQSIADRKQAQTRLKQAQSDSANDAIRQTQIAQAKAQGASAKAKMANAQVQLDDTNVVAPSDGIILKKYVEEGTLITSGISLTSAGASIVQLGDISRMYVDVQVDETDVANVEEGQKVDVTVDAYNTHPFEGKVIKVLPLAAVEQNVTTIHVRVEVDNSDGAFRLLRPGMNSTCEFIIGKQADVIAVPKEALHTETDGSMYVETAQGGKPAPADKAEEADPNLLVGLTKTKVTLDADSIGLKGNELTEIKKGVKAGDRLITQTIEPTAAAPPGGANPFRGGGPGPGRR